MYEKNPDELGTIFVSRGRGAYEDTLFFGGKAFEIPNGTYEIENVRGVSKKTGQSYHLLRVFRTAPTVDVDAEIARAHAMIDGEEVPF